MKLKKRSIGDLFLKRVQLSSEDNSVGWIEDDIIKFIDYQQYKNTVETLALALKKHGIKRQDKVAILGNTTKEWHFCDLALLCSGSVVVPIYHTYTGEEIAYILNHSEAKMLIVEDEKQLKKLVPIMGELKYLKQIVMLNKLGANTQIENRTFYDYEDLLIEGRDEVQSHPDMFERIIEETPESDIASIIYTSGTTGEPKGAVIKQSALTQMLLNVKKFSHHAFATKDRALTFLPLSHVFGRTDSLLPLIFGWECVYARSIQTIIDDIALVKPTIMLSVPRIFEKIYAKIFASVEKSNLVKQHLFDWAIDKAKAYFNEIDRDKTPSTKTILQYQLAYQLVFSKIYNMFGGRIRYFISGGAPLSVEIIQFLRYSGLTILEGYGLTETIAPCVLNPFSKQLPGSVGQPLGDVQISFAPDKEILIKSDALFSEYYKNEEKTKEVIDSDGWFHTGDIGEFTNDGYLMITDRKKDIIITSGGKNIAPQKIENLAKLQPHIAQCILIGDKRKYLTALIAIEKEDFQAELAQLGISTDLDLAEIVARPEIHEIVSSELEAVNGQLARFETIKEYYLLPTELTTDNYLTPSLKVKKKKLISDYESEIDAMYQD
ncbi:MAG: long-chain fatty acid--CoA ligase [Bacteriovoracaceae bacterium]|nr:long-chain fatty acid--CoA ligase [Bacteriovoracaceae bacterium]